MKMKLTRQHKQNNSNATALLEQINSNRQNGNEQRAKTLELRFKKRYGKITRG